MHGLLLHMCLGYGRLLSSRSLDAMMATHSLLAGQIVAVSAEVVVGPSLIAGNRTPSLEL